MVPHPPDVQAASIPFRGQVAGQHDILPHGGSDRVAWSLHSELGWAMEKGTEKQVWHRGVTQGITWGCHTRHRKGQCLELCMGELHGSVAREHCMEHCVGTSHREGKRGLPTTDPIPIPAPAQPQVRIIPAETGNARVPVRLSCHIWGFYPPEVTVIWLHNGDIVEPDDYNPISAIPNGDWSYQTQVSLLVAPVAGDTYTCSVQHVSLQEPLLEDWREWRGAQLGCWVGTCAGGLRLATSPTLQPCSLASHPRPLAFSPAFVAQGRVPRRS
uniref:Ig-like domain-containing protein n=1 Tax=Anas platyrhynchos platyrhynchos TaxID=8840 RepID=A0A493TEK4_ANAPP